SAAQGRSRRARSVRRTHLQVGPRRGQEAARARRSTTPMDRAVERSWLSSTISFGARLAPRRTHAVPGCVHDTLRAMGAPKKADWREERRKRAWALKQEAGCSEISPPCWQGVQGWSVRGYSERVREAARTR